MGKPAEWLSQVKLQAVIGPFLPPRGEAILSFQYDVGDVARPEGPASTMITSSSSISDLYLSMLAISAAPKPHYIWANSLMHLDRTTS